MRAAKGVILLHLVSVFVGEIEAKAAAGPEAFAVNGVGDDVLPPVGAPFLG